MKVHEMIRDYYPAYYSIEHYPASQVVCIRKTSDEWGILGKFAMVSVATSVACNPRKRAQSFWIASGCSAMYGRKRNPSPMD